MPLTNYTPLALACGLVSLIALCLIAFLLRLLHQIASLKTQLRLSRENAHQAFYDYLTGLLNRRGWDRAMREMPPTRMQSMVMLDLDQFKQTNDRHGHRMGDRVLKEFADRLKNGFESSGATLARLGGEEFAIFSRQPSESLVEIVQHWLDTGASSPLNDSQQSIVIRCSAGVAQRIEGESIEEWQDRADRALYEAKQSGGNCVRSDHRSS
ncbi:MAG: GGDEF domain-containing protein [Planctomycetota bacterium]|nr:GGDEF domain-containing protein [Planctomycetota bacterium]